MFLAPGLMRSSYRVQLYYKVMHKLWLQYELQLYCKRNPLVLVP